MKRVFLLTHGAALALTGCDSAAAGDRAPKVHPIEAQGTPPERTRSAPRTESTGSTAGDIGAAARLYEEVKRLDAACVEAGGGVSGSPDCDAAIAQGRRLEQMGYCIDYPDDEKLARCDDLARRRRK